MKRSAEHDELASAPSPVKHARAAARREEASSAVHTSTDRVDDAAGGHDGAELDADVPSKPARRKSLAPSPHAGPSAFRAGVHLPLTHEGLIATLPSRTSASAADGDAVAARTLKVISWNVNGIRAAVSGDRRKGLLSWVRCEAPDVLAMQEIKIDEAELGKGGFATLFPTLPHAEFACCHTQKGYAGTAIYSRSKPLRVLRGLDFASLGASYGGEAVCDSEGRMLTVELPSLFIVNVYTPNSGMKLERLEYRTRVWDPAFQAFTAALTAVKPTLIVGDLNVAFHDMDLHAPKTNRNKVPGFCDAERNNFAALLGAGFHDVWRERNPDLQQFTYWSSRFNCRASNKGWRLDYALASSSLVPRVVDTFIRGSYPSPDHIPIGIELLE